VILRYTLTIHYMDKKQQPVTRKVLNLETNHIYTYINEYDNKMNYVCNYSITNNSNYQYDYLYLF